MGDLPRESWNKNTENPTFTRRQQTFIIGGARRGSYKSCNGLPLNISQCHQKHTYLQEKTNNQYLWWWLGKKMISVHPLFSRAPVSISARNQQHTQNNIQMKCSNHHQLILPHQSEHMQISQEAKMQSKIGAVHKVCGLSRATSQNLSRFEVRERQYWAIQAFQGTTCLKVCAFVARLWWVHSTLESSSESKDSQMDPMFWKKFRSVTLNPGSNHVAMGVKNSYTTTTKVWRLRQESWLSPSCLRLGGHLTFQVRVSSLNSEEAWQTLG
jgi:hypothetical protein